MPNSTVTGRAPPEDGGIYCGTKFTTKCACARAFLLQAWADAFRSSPDLTGVVHIYEELKRKGIEFPMADLDALSPIHTPQRVGGVWENTLERCSMLTLRVCWFPRAHQRWTQP